MESSVSDLDAYRCNPFRGYYDAALQFCPKWSCNFVHFWFATFGIFIMQQTPTKKGCSLTLTPFQYSIIYLNLKIIPRTIRYPSLDFSTILF